MIFKLDKYYHSTRYKYVFADYLLDKEDKAKQLHDLAIDYDVFRVEKSRDIVNNDNINVVLDFLEINSIDYSNKIKYEKCINNMYYAIYYRDRNKICRFIDELDEYILENNYLKPIFVMFRVYANMIIYSSITDIEEHVKNDLDYLAKFKKNYFIDEYELIYEFILISFKRKSSLINLANLGIKYEKLNWIYLSIKGSLQYLSENDNDVLRCCQILEEEFEEQHNVERLMITRSNICFTYNALDDYDKAYKLSKKMLSNVFSDNKSIWVQNTLMNYLFANYMLERYDEIIELFTNEIFDLNRLNWLTATICILAAYFNKELYKANDIIDLFKFNKYVAIILEYIESKNKDLLLEIKQTTYIDKIISKL